MDDFGAAHQTEGRHRLDSPEDSSVRRRVARAQGEALAAADYLAELAGYLTTASGVCWKLERAQLFHEPDYPSWVAMTQGDWPFALQLIDEMRSGMVESYASIPEFRRVRVVEFPVSPYLQWELHVLMARLDAGERIRAVPAGMVGHLESSEPLPELLIVAEDLMYEILYDDRGGHVGARRITDTEVVADCRRLILGLWDGGEDLRAYFDREIACLPPPTEHP